MGEDNSGGSAAPEQSLSWLGLIPIVIGVALAFVYALGAISTYGQLRHEGLNAIQTTPLVPLEQILGRGIGSVVSIFGKSLFNLLIVAIVFGGYIKERHDLYVKHPEEWPWWIKYGLPAALALYALVGSWGSALVLAIGLGSMFGVWALGAVRGISGTRSLAIGTLAFLVSLVTLSVATSLIEPPPLPRVVLHRFDGHLVHGALVAETGDNWYVAYPDHVVKAIPNGAVDRAVITYENRKQRQSLLSEIFA